MKEGTDFALKAKIIFDIKAWKGLGSIFFRTAISNKYVTVHVALVTAETFGP
jgi:hypothetical protein